MFSFRAYALFLIAVLILLAGAPAFAQTSLPPPPPANRCHDENYLPVSSMRTSIPEPFRDSLRCRVFYAGSAPVRWNNGPLYSTSAVGDEGVVDLGIIGAVDVFSPNGLREFYDAAICLRGFGAIYLFNDPFANTPREPVETPTWTTAAFPGFTCVTLYRPATVVLVREPSSFPVLRVNTAGDQLVTAQEQARAAVALADCRVTLNYTVRLRQFPTTAAFTLARIPHTTVLAADYRAANGWYRVTWNGQIGWVSGSTRLTTPEGTCS